MKGPVRIAVDIGGTFTDLQFLEESSGRTDSHKTPTTPENPAIGLVTGISEAMDRLGFETGQVTGLMHGTTIATNAILQRRFARSALLTTAGFEDVLQIGRHVRRDVYSQVAEARPLLIERRLRLGVDERVDAQGHVLKPVRREQIAELAGVLREAQIESVAVCLLNSFSNPEHETAIAQWLAHDLPRVNICVSSRISPEVREYERTSTTVLNALLMPVVSRYIDQLASQLQKIGIVAPVYLVQSNGGVTTPDIAAEQPVRLILSGPSGGARAVEVIAAQRKVSDLIAIDMGGTSFDVSVIRDQRANLQTQGEIDTIPVRIPMLEIRTIGAGGGSLAMVDDGGRLTVGPDSAGADPGPVAYQRGGTQPTVTDANVALGRIDPDYFLGGTISLSAKAANDAIDKTVAGPLAMRPEHAASGIVDIAVSHLAGAIRLSLFEKGLDPKDFALVSFGGAGGLHAAMVADQLGSLQVLFPPDAGTQSAWGMLFANVVHDVSQACQCPAVSQSVGRVDQVLTGLREQVADLLSRSDVAPDRRVVEVSFDLRYPGQGYELTVPASGTRCNAAMIDAVASDFHHMHLERFAHHDPRTVPELVTVRLRGIGKMIMPQAAQRHFGEAREPGRRRVYLNDQWQELPVYRRDDLQPDQQVQGPLVVEEPHSTILLPGGWSARMHADGMLIATSKIRAQGVE